jgi:hypothetical protein
VRSQRTIVPALLLLTLCAAAQEQPAATPAPTPGAQEPKIRVTYLNVCTPPDDEKKALVEALEHVPAKPPLAADFEVARGRSTMSGGELAARLTGGNLPPSTWVRMRREFASGYSSPSRTA